MESEVQGIMSLDLVEKFCGTNQFRVRTVFQAFTTYSIPGTSKVTPAVLPIFFIFFYSPPHKRVIEIILVSNTVYYQAQFFGPSGQTCNGK